MRQTNNNPTLDEMIREQTLYYIHMDDLENEALDEIYNSEADILAEQYAETAWLRYAENRETASDYWERQREEWFERMSY